jgi:hypothetical protein
MTLDQIDQMVRQANPVPDLTVLEPVDASVLVFDQQRRMEMQTHDRVEVDQEPEKSRRGLLVGIAAAAVIVIGVLIFARPMDAPVASPVEVAAEFVEAYGSFDIDRAFSYLAADAAGVDSLTEERLLARFMEAIGTKNISTGPCEEVSTTPDGTLVRCPFEYHMLRSDEIGRGPYGPNAYNLTVMEGKVVSFDITGNSLTDGFSNQVWMPFADWIAIAHPDDVAIMYQDDSQTGWKVTEESIPLWEQRSLEYVAIARDGAEAENIANQFVEAYAAGDADKTISYLAADADLSGFIEGGVEGLRPSIRFDEATGFQRLFDSCVATGATPTGMSVRCTYDYHGIRSEEIELGPYSGSWLDIAIEDGRIVSVSDEIVFMENGFSEQMWEPFAVWIARTYPEDGPIMYENWPNIFMAQFTDESIELWEERSIEYVAVVKGS